MKKLITILFFTLLATFNVLGQEILAVYVNAPETFVYIAGGDGGDLDLVASIQTGSSATSFVYNNPMGDCDVLAVGAAEYPDLPDSLKVALDVGFPHLSAPTLNKLSVEIGGSVKDELSFAGGYFHSIFPAGTLIVRKDFKDQFLSGWSPSPTLSLTSEQDDTWEGCTGCFDNLPAGDILPFEVILGPSFELVGGCADGAFLPIELENIEGQTDGPFNKLSWAGYQENVERFQIQRRGSQRDEWELIGFVEAQSGNGYFDYSFVDSVPPLRTAYYRLETIDFGEETGEYSPVVPVTRTSSIIVSNPYPSPAHIRGDGLAEVNLRVESPSSEDRVPAQIFSLTSDLIYDGELGVGENKILFPASSGIYLVKVSLPGEIKTLTVVVVSPP